MVWIKDIWIYFLADESNVNEAYLNRYNDEVYFFEQGEDIPEDMVKIPQKFTKVGLLRNFIDENCDKNLKKLADRCTDDELCNIYHGTYSHAYDEDNFYSEWVPYGKKKVFEYAKNWCADNGFNCTEKEPDKYDKYTYLDCL